MSKTLKHERRRLRNSNSASRQGRQLFKWGRMSRACLPKAFFVNGRMPKHPQTTLSLCFVLSLTYCFHLVVDELEYDVLTFSYARLSKLKLLRMYYLGDRSWIFDQTLYSLQSKLFLQLTVFNAFFNNVFNEFISLSHFIKPFSLKTWREATSFNKFVCDFQILYGWPFHRVRTSVA